MSFKDGKFYYIMCTQLHNIHNLTLSMFDDPECTSKMFDKQPPN